MCVAVLICFPPSKLEVYSYMFSDGGLNLYFVNGSEEINYIAFAPKGVVY